MDMSHLIRRFACGYAQGAKAVNADIKVVANMTGTTPAAWNDPVKGSELTKAQISQGAGRDPMPLPPVAPVWACCKLRLTRTSYLSVVDSNQNYIAPRQGSDLDDEGGSITRFYNAFSDGARYGRTGEFGSWASNLNHRGRGFCYGMSITRAGFRCNGPRRPITRHMSSHQVPWQVP